MRLLLLLVLALVLSACGTLTKAPGPAEFDPWSTPLPRMEPVIIDDIWRGSCTRTPGRACYATSSAALRGS
jgi:hypothetical protein